MLDLNIRRNGVVLSTVFMKLGVLVQITVAMIFYGEIPKPLQVLGFLLAIIAILLIYFEKTNVLDRGVSKLLLPLLMLIGGTSDCLLNVYEKSGVPEYKNHFLFFIFVSAAVLCLMILVIKQKKPLFNELLWGALIGIPNYYSSRFLLLSLKDIPAIVAYPVYNIGVILIVCIIGHFVFAEKLSRKKLIGMLLIVVSLLLLNI